MTTLLEIRGLNTYYGESHILRDVDLTVNAGEMVCLIGRYGVGKTTLLKSLIGLLRPRRGEVVFNADPLDRQAPYQRARAGVGYVPQGREIIPQLTVEENLMLGMEALPGGLARNRRIDPFVYELFPVLQEFQPRKGGDLSGGSSSNWRSPGPCSASPSAALLDEPTEGIQPNIVQAIESAVKRIIAETGIGAARRAASALRAAGRSLLRDAAWRDRGQWPHQRPQPAVVDQFLSV